MLRASSACRPGLVLLTVLACSNSMRVSGVRQAKDLTEPRAYMQLGTAASQVSKRQSSATGASLRANTTQDLGKIFLLEMKQIPATWTHKASMPVFFGLGMLTVFLCAIIDFRSRSRADPESGFQSQGEAGQGSSVGQRSISVDTGFPTEPPERSLLVIVLLTSYRFYTGFLGATWVPFLIAKEGETLLSNGALLSVASFMGICKLIYGFSIFLNPFFGLLSDKLAASSPWGGRSAFLLAGVGLAGMGIYGAKNASESGDMVWYLVSSCLWMLGEAMADISTETVAPVMLPPSQYDKASSTKTVLHLIGGLSGYLCLMAAAVGELHWHWLYVTYLVLMLLFSLPTAACVWSLQGGTWSPPSGRGHTGPVLASLFEAYIAPTRYAGGFPRACYAAGIFCLGTGPLFFTWLMLHDLVGLKSAKEQQMHFAGVSMTFLLAACITAVWSGMERRPEPAQPPSRRQSAGAAEASSGSSGEEESPRRATGGAGAVSGSGDAGAGPSVPAATPNTQLSDLRWTHMFWSVMAYGLTCCVIPTVSLAPSQDAGLMLFYVISFFLGLTFGSVYSRFQACTWSLIPPHADIGNAMGFAAVTKCAGVGIGNFAAGLILDGFRRRVDIVGQSYGNAGYMAMAWSSAFCVFVSAALVLSISQTRRKLLKYLP